MAAAEVPSACVDSVEAVYGEKTNISERFPGLKGLRLQEKVWALYAVREGECLHFFDEAEQPQLVMHAMNDRHQQQAPPRS